MITKTTVNWLGCLAAGAMLTACQGNVSSDKQERGDSSSLSQAFDTEIDGKEVKLFELKNNNLRALITNYGGRVVGLTVPDKEGNPVDVVVGMESAEAYRDATEPYFGALIGRVGNRIAKGTFALDGKEYNIFTNNGPNTLHGGKIGFQYRVWEAEQPNDSTLVLHYLSPDGEEGFPGNLHVKVTYTATSQQGLKMDYEATTDKPAPVNLTNHAFFNLNGEGSGSINNHRLMIKADQFTPVDSTLIPMGRHDPVAGTPFDFRKLTAIGVRVEEDHEQLGFGKGYDHNFVLTKSSPTEYIHAAQAIGDKTGIVMDVYTSEPGIQFYGGNFMQGQNVFKTGVKDEFRTAFCLETQHFPDSPNQPSFPSIILKPGDTYRSTSEYIFSAEQ